MVFWFGDFVLRILIKVPLYLAVSAAALLHFKGLLHVISIMSSDKAPSTYLNFLKPIIKAIGGVLKEAFGKPEAFKFSLTEVVLVAILLAIFSLATHLEEQQHQQQQQHAQQLQQLQQLKQQH